MLIQSVEFPFEQTIAGIRGVTPFIDFLPETNSETAMQVAERLREIIAKTPIRIPDKEVQISVSIGVSRRDENTLELETLIARADQAMYVAKYRGATGWRSANRGTLQACFCVEHHSCCPYG